MFILARAGGFSGCRRRTARFQSPQRPSPPYSIRDIFRLTRVTRIFQKSVFTKTTRVIAIPVRPCLRRASTRNIASRHPYGGYAVARLRRALAPTRPMQVGWACTHKIAIVANQAPLLRAWNLRPHRMLGPSRASDGPKENQTEAANQIPETLGSSRPRFCYYIGCIDCFYDDRWDQRLDVWEFG
jgi:hypothetical protein